MKLLDRELAVLTKHQLELDQMEEQVKLAEKLGMKGVARAIRMRHKFKLLKALQFPRVTREEISAALQIDPKTERMEESMLAPCDYGNVVYAGLMPFGAMLAIDELITGGICELKDFVVFYPEDILKKDPILVIQYPDMDKVSRFQDRSFVSEYVYFQVAQWD